MVLKKLAGFLVLCLTATAVEAFPQSTSHEEEVVRATYATVSFLCGLEPVTHATLAQLHQEYVSKKKLDQDVADATPVFELSEFHSGSIASIANAKWGDMFSVPDKGLVLRGGVGGNSYSDIGDGSQSSGWKAGWTEAKVHWDTDRSYTPDRIAAMQKVTVAEAIKLISQEKEWGTPAIYTKYVTFTVNVTFAGKSASPYQAIFLFGKDAEGKEAVVPLDAVGASGQLLWAALYPTAYPSEILRSKLRELPIMDRWIQANRVPRDQCSSARTDLCCADGRCALPESAVARDLAVPLPLQR